MQWPVGPRTRASSVSLQSPHIVDFTTYPGGSTTRTTYVQNYRTIADHMDDVVVERYHERSAQGELFNNPCLKLRTEVLKQMGTFRIESQHNGDNYVVVISQGGPDAAMDMIPDLDLDAQDVLSTAITAAATRAKAKVTSEAMLLGATLGELKETKEMVFNACIHLRHFNKSLKYYATLFNDVRKSKWSRFSKGYKELENAWMGVRMGWRPFYGELQTLHQALKVINEFPQRQTFRAKETFTLQNADMYTLYDAYAQEIKWQRTAYGNYTVRAGFLAQQRYGGVPDTFGLTKFPQTLWELTKLSWCVDYFLNVADLIAAYTPDSLWTPVFGWVTVKSTETYVNTFNSIRHLTLPGYQYSSSLHRRTTTVYTHSRKPDPPIGLAFLPKMNWAKYIDTAFVTRQLLGNTIKMLKGVKAFKRKT